MAHDTFGPAICIMQLLTPFDPFVFLFVCLFFKVVSELELLVIQQSICQPQQVLDYFPVIGQIMTFQNVIQYAWNMVN